jgi:hypothetical protein
MLVRFSGFVVCEAAVELQEPSKSAAPVLALIPLVPADKPSTIMFGFSWQAAEALSPGYIGCKVSYRSAIADM